MEKYRIIYLGDGKYLGWDAVAKRFIPASMFLYVTVYNSIDEAFLELRKIRGSHSGWVSDVYVDKISRDLHGENRPEVKQYLY